MGGLGRDGGGWRFFQGSVLVEGLMLGFHVPWFTLARGAVVERPAGLAGHPLPKTRAAIVGGEALLEEHQRPIDAFPIALRGSSLRVSTGRSVPTDRHGWLAR